MRLTVNVDLNGADFDEDGFEGAVQNILEQACEKVNARKTIGWCEWTLFDRNGNACGEVRLTDDDE